MTRVLNPEQQTVLEFRNSLCLSAGAGSGKTRTLVEKYLQLLLDEGRQPPEILAITFTEKAAAEMLARIREAIQKRIHEETDPQRCGDLEDKLMNLGAGWISTIHSFGARLLREHPAEAGVDPAFAPLPEQESQILWESAALAAVMEMADRDPAVGELALRLGLHGGRRGAGLLTVLRAIKLQLDSRGCRPEDFGVVDSVEGPTAATRRSAVPAHRPTGMSDAQAGATLIESLNRLSELPGPGPTLQRKLPAFRRLARDLGGDPGGAPVAPSRLLRLLARAGWDE